MEIAFRKKLTALLGLWILIWISYSSSLTATWHLDDFPNIVTNEKIHLSQVTYNALIATFFASPSENFYRPLPMVSFALNWYYCGAEVFGYHIVNVIIHCINSLLLYIVVLNLLQTPKFLGSYTGREIHWIALIAAAFWALNPVQTQAVTYIVQRMASMAALFYLGGIYLYLKYKKAKLISSKRMLLSATVLSYFFAVLSKENAVLLPISLSLIDTIFFPSNEGHVKNKKNQTAAALLLCTLVVGLAFFAIERGNPLQFIQRLYADRPFTVTERLLTGPRILLLYLSLLFFPLPSRLSLCRDISVSTSLVEPWTTLPAILLVFIVFVLSILYYRNKPLISFAILFFLLNHSIESSIIPLELVFEHRNYLPSLFIFLPLTNYFVKIGGRFCSARKYRNYLVALAVLLPLSLMGNWTFARNMVWQTEKTLWEDEILKNPNLARPYHNLAWGYYQSRGMFNDALNLYFKALSSKAQTPFETARTMNNIGRIKYLVGEYEPALEFFEKATDLDPKLKIAEYQIVTTLIQLGRWQEALEKIDSASLSDQSNASYLKLKGLVLSKMGSDDAAISLLSKSLQQNPNAVDTRAHLSLALGRLGRFEEAIDHLTKDRLIDQENPQLLMILSEIERMRGHDHMSDNYLNQFMNRLGVEKSRNMMLLWEKDNLSPNLDYDLYLSKLNRLEK